MTSRPSFWRCSGQTPKHVIINTRKIYFTSHVQSMIPKKLAQISKTWAWMTCQDSSTAGRGTYSAKVSGEWSNPPPSRTWRISSRPRAWRCTEKATKGNSITSNMGTMAQLEVLERSCWRQTSCGDHSLLKDTSRRSLGKKKSFTKNPFKNTVPVVQPIPLISIGNLRGICEPSSFTRVFEVPNPHVRIQPILTLPKLPVGLAENSVYFWFHKNIPNLFQMKILIPFCGCKATPHWLQLLTKRTKKHTTDEAPRTQTNQKKAPTRKRANKPQRRGWCRDGLLMEGWYGCPRDLDYEAILHDL